MTLMSLWWLVLRERRFLAAAGRGIRSDACSTAARVDGDGTNPWRQPRSAAGPWCTASACRAPSFPACRGEWWPAGNLLAAFATTARPDLATAILLEVSHRLGALIALIYVTWLGLHVWHIGTRDHLCRYGMLVLATLLAAAGLGIMGAVTWLPPVTAVAHSAAAALLLLSLVTLYHVARPATRSEKRST